MRCAALATILMAAACGQAAPPAPVTPGIETSGTGVSIDVSGEGKFGVSVPPP